MTAPIPLFGRDQVPQPDGEPEITMFMDDDRIIFRDQQALDAYTQADADAALERAAQAIEAGYLGPDSGRQHDGRDAPDAAQRNAYDEGLQHAASIVRAQKQPEESR